ncbi:unnamed protein product [Rotaria sp. Silwood1]|nr:unnamed protein product [Rotaria sp. Silwood1]CAF1612926.1 unnamed protein product [Rotaria sp. Silwood1]CAF3767597.1 unnamed protein product [Rotaria sp. Silwood1]CAF3771911.1 unnamed protein product [Rotaria sp. Silwood1]
MLTSDDKKRRVQWAKQHKNDNFTRTIFADEASFQLFRNAIRRWTKHPNTEFKRIPKNRQKVHDNDPKHASNITKQFINANVPQLLEWPSNSPDVNPIENI